jgi:hypothetical protein
VLSPKAAAEAEIKIAAKRAKDAASKKFQRGDYLSNIDIDIQWF